MFMSIWRRRKRSALRSAMRGYLRLRDAGQIGSIDHACADLAAKPFDIPPTQLSPDFFGAGIGKAELAIRQYVYLRRVLYRLPQALLAHVTPPSSPLAFPLPSEWRDALSAAGYAIDGPRSRLLWAAWLFLYWGYGVFSIGRLLLLSAAAGLSRRRTEAQEFSHFEYIATSETPRPARDGKSFDVMSWYLRWNGRAPDVRTLSYRGRPHRRDHGDFAIEARRTPFLAILGPKAWFLFAGWSIRAITVALLDIPRGRWWHAVLLGEAALARVARAVPASSLARDYLLNNSGWLYRPLWTYEAEQRGSRILFYHYSTNSAAFKRSDGYSPEHYTWALTNWPLHLVWDRQQAEFVQRAVGATDVEIVGPIWFSSSPDAITKLNPASIAVFDVQPFRTSRSLVLAADFNYYTAETCSAFVRDVARACAETGFDMVWKRKRSIGKLAHPQYRKVAASLDAQSHVRLVPTEHSAIRVIERCCAAISLPFTSTALLAKHLGRPSCYYDPSGQLQKDDRAAHDIPILSDYDELIGWIRSVQNATPCPEINRSSS